MDLPSQIRKYYLDNYTNLPFDKQFHFASRLAAWSEDTTCQKFLMNQKSRLLPSQKSAHAMLDELLHNPPEAAINAAGLRTNYFLQYPNLRPLMLVLFRVRHLLAIYNTDIRAHLVLLVPYEQLHQLSRELMEDHEAVRILSTYAVNYVYLVERILFDVHAGVLDEKLLYSLGEGYNLENKEKLLLLIYLYTHCIIGETNFYVGKIPDAKKTVYNKMLLRLETLIHDRYDDINLDNKLEFLVCCKIMGYKTTLFGRIHQECEQSISKEGTFLVDTLNSAGQSNKTSFAGSEHRNVLYIMSATNWQHG
jgi:hypothetical protein